MSKDALDQLKEKSILSNMANKYKAKLSIKEVAYTKWRLKFLNGNRIYIKEVALPENTSMFRLFFDES